MEKNFYIQMGEKKNFKDPSKSNTNKISARLFIHCYRISPQLSFSSPTFDAQRFWEPA